LSSSRRSCQPVLQISPPLILDVLDIGEGRTGLVVDIAGFDGRSLHLVEYVDGLAFDAMQILWAIDAAG
jgi:hypothetical protein